MPDRSTKPIVVIGPMGAGKTSVGKKLARALGRSFIDTDRVFVRTHGPIADFFETEGEERFRALEHEVVVSSLGDAKTVVSLGGGAVLHPETQTRLGEVTVILLSVSPEAVAARIAGSDRPLLHHDGLASWTAIAAARAPIYDSLADFTVDTSNRPIAHVVDDIVRWVGTDDK